MKSGCSCDCQTNFCQAFCFSNGYDDSLCNGAGCTCRLLGCSDCGNVNCPSGTCTTQGGNCNCRFDP